MMVRFLTYFANCWFVSWTKEKFGWLWKCW